MSCGGTPSSITVTMAVWTGKSTDDACGRIVVTGCVCADVVSDEPVDGPSGPITVL